MRQCPKCNSNVIHRSRTKGWLESWRKAMTAKRPHRCQTCGWRGWGDDSVFRFGGEHARKSEKAVVSDPPAVDLSRL